MRQKLDGLVVAVTGAARGTGYTIARKLKAAGADVAISDLDQAALSVAVDDLAIECYARLDVTDPAAYGDFLRLVEARKGPLWALVHNVVELPSRALFQEREAWTRRSAEISARGSTVGTSKALELMAPRGQGHIIRVMSMIGDGVTPNLLGFGTDRAEPVAFADAVCLQIGESGERLSTTWRVRGAGPTRMSRLTVRGDVADAVVRTLQRGQWRSRRRASLHRPVLASSS